MKRVGGELSIPIEEIIQSGADRTRAFKACLRNRDDEGAIFILGEIRDEFGEDIASAFFVKNVGDMIENEDFSFVSE